MAKLEQRHCIPCSGEVPPLAKAEREALLAQLEGWSVVKNHHLSKTCKLPDFKTALAQAEGHHPDLVLAWGKVGAELWTHAAGGLTENDFILAAKIDAVADLKKAAKAAKAKR